MTKAIAIRTAKSGKVEILCTGLKGDCMEVARKESAKIKGIGDACIEVFVNSIWNDDGRKVDYQRRLAADQKPPPVAKPVEKASKTL